MPVWWPDSTSKQIAPFIKQFPVTQWALGYANSMVGTAAGLALARLSLQCAPFLGSPSPGTYVIDVELCYSQRKLSVIGYRQRRGELANLGFCVIHEQYFLYSRVFTECQILLLYFGRAHVFMGTRSAGRTYRWRLTVVTPTCQSLTCAQHGRSPKALRSAI